MRELALNFAPVAKKIVVALLVVVAFIPVVVFLSRDEGGPIPTQASLANYGLAGWPEDTLGEAIDECADAESWRSDARATARRFGREMLNYPEPGVGNPTPVRDHVRYLIGSKKLARRTLFWARYLILGDTAAAGTWC
jgi:hypothetical protein